MHYETIVNEKNKEWILLIHCIASNHKLFKRQIKAYLNNFNILLIDLPGHGKSLDIENFSFKSISDKIVEVMNDLNIDKLSIVSISLGTIIAMYMSLIYPEKINKMVLGGAVLGVKNRFLKLIIRIVVNIKKTLPIEFSIRRIAFFILPKKNQKRSRKILTKSALKLKKHHLFLWLDLIYQYVNEYDKFLKDKINNNKISKLYLMGDKDIIFIGSVLKNVVINDYNKIKTIKNCGHICNIERVDKFNNISLDFLIN